jgi:transposase-like protein
MQQEEMTFVDFMNRFKTEEDCREHFFKIKWSNGFRCPKCNHEEYTLINGYRRYQCHKCRHQTSLTAGTIMHRSHTGLREWFLVIYLFTHDKRGISAAQVARNVGLSYETAWLMLHKLRKTMGDRDSHYYLDDIVEMDEAFFGGPGEGSKRGRGTEKTPAVVAVSLNEEGQPEYVKIQVLEQVNGASVVDMAKDTITPGATIQTDGLGIYRALNDAGYEQQGENFDPENSPQHLHWVHVVISNLKALMVGTYHGLGKKHIQNYFDEFCWRFNRRRFGNQLFNRLLAACTSSSTITYAQLVGPAVA